MRRRRVSFGLAVMVVVVFMVVGLLEKPDQVPQRVKMKSRIDGVRHIHQMIKTKTGQEDIGYSDEYLSLAIAKSGDRSKEQAKVSNDIPWVERGPGNIGGRTRSILVDASDVSNNTWLVGTAGGGIWRTTNAGDAWTNVTPNMPNLATVTIAQSSANPGIMYAGTGEGGLGGNFVNGIGIYKSLDGGLNWAILQSTTGENVSNFLNTNRIIVHPENANLLYAATSNGVRQDFISGIFKSENGGLSWEQLLEANSRVQQLAFDPEDPNTIYASLILNGIYKSTDGGASWYETPLSSIVLASGGEPGRTEFAIAPTNPNKIYASVAYNRRTGSGLYWSTDKGESWKEIRDPAQDGTDFLLQGEYDNSIAIDPSDENKVYWGGVELWTGTVDEMAIGTSTRDFIGVDQENTETFLSFVNFNAGTHFGNRLLIGNPQNTPNIEIRFGGLTQKAHRFHVPVGGNAGVPANDYTYQDYVDVPFEVWDIDANRQLMVSFRDQSRDGAFNLNFRGLDADESINREYIFIHNRSYDANTPDVDLTVDGGHENDQLVFVWPTLTDGGTWDPDNLPSSVFRMKFAVIQFQEGNIIEMPGTNTVHDDHHLLTFAGDRLISVNDGGVAFSDNKGLLFTERETGLVTSQYYSADKKPRAQVYIGGTQDNDVNLSSLNPSISTSWDDNAFFNFFGDGFEVVWNRDGRRVLGSNQFNFIFRSDDEGANWSESRAGISDSDFFGEDPDAPFFTKIAYSKLGPDRTFAVSDNGIWVSQNFGERWSIRNVSNQWGGALDIEVSDVDTDVVWAGGAMDADRKLFVSTDGGNVFNTVNVFEAYPDKGNITTIVTDPNDRQTAYVVFSQPAEPKIIKTTDLGQTWTDISGFVDGVSTVGFPDVGTFSLLVFPDPNRMWAGTEIGVYETLDGGASWNILPNSFPAVTVWDMKVVDGEVIMATHGRGIWTADMGIDYPSQELLLNANEPIEEEPVVYPNPSQGKFSVIIDGRPINRLEVWSLEGKLIQVFDEPQESYSLDQKGLFLTRIYQEGKIITGKLVID
ncbi:MAG: T9SS type A sorting domain-containing protein [Cytophagales bacterium]|nr:T9SS type A sorting domain-containing protein [Cytophagales bacterium]